MKKDQTVFNNLVILLTQFKTRPYYLAKFLIRNSCLSENFIKKLNKSDKFKSIKNLEDINFYDISHMEDYFESLLLDKQFLEERTLEQITIELNEKLKKSIEEERYEDSQKLRDYMLKNNIKIL